MPATDGRSTRKIETERRGAQDTRRENGYNEGKQISQTLKETAAGKEAGRGRHRNDIATPREEENQVSASGNRRMNEVEEGT